MLPWAILLAIYLVKGFRIAWMIQGVMLGKDKTYPYTKEDEFLRELWNSLGLKGQIIATINLLYICLLWPIFVYFAEKSNSEGVD